MVELNETLELGIAKIDDQHQTLIQTLEDIYDACSRGEGMKQLEQTLKFLEWYVSKHFDDEEIIQRKCNYPAYKGHKAIHELYVNEIREIKKDFEANKLDTTNLSKVTAYLIKMIKSHIEHEDRLLADYIKKKHTDDEIAIQASPIGRDYLTGLLTREEFNKHFTELIEALNDREYSQLEYIVMRIDGFEQVNKSYGYDIGDEVIIYAAGILHRVDYKGVIVGRVHRDEFIMCIPHQGNREELMTLLENIKRQIYCGFNRKGSVVPLSMSMGIVSLTDTTTNIKQIHQKAIIALGVAYELGRNQTVWFEEQMYEKTKNKAKMLNMLQPYNLSQYLKLMYQPIYDVSSQVVIGAEALLRMIDETGKIISPLEFIPLAEENHLMKEIGYFCIEQACQVMSQVKKIGSSLHYISINLSVQQFRDPKLVAKIEKYSKYYGIEPQYLHFEIVESMIIDNFVETQKILGQLKALGCKILLDDFGSGYSALSYLSHMAIDIVKIDRSFLKTIEYNSKANTVLRGIIQLVHELEMETVVEGVECEMELDKMKEFDVDKVQGYFLSRPVSQNDFLKLVQ